MGERSEEVNHLSDGNASLIESIGHLPDKNISPNPVSMVTKQQQQQQQQHQEQDGNGGGMGGVGMGGQPSGPGVGGPIGPARTQTQVAYFVLLTKLLGL